MSEIKSFSDYLAIAQLSFNGRFALAVRRIAGVDYGGHGCTSLYISFWRYFV